MIAEQSTSIVTRLHIRASPRCVWDSLMFYETIEGPPPLHLRVLLPRPIRTQGSKSTVGDKATCLYQGGHLLKRVTKIDRLHRYEFVIAEQHLTIGAGNRQHAGSGLPQTTICGSARTTRTVAAIKIVSQWVTRTPPIKIS